MSEENIVSEMDAGMDAIVYDGDQGRNIVDEMEALGPVRLSEVQEAQKRIINVARRMSDEGSIVLAGRGGDDYV